MPEENTVEKVVLLKRLRKADAHVRISVDMDELNKFKEFSRKEKMSKLIAKE